MSTLRSYLWKEWREHKKALLAVALVSVAMMTGFAWLFASRRVLQAPLFPMVSCVVAVLIAVLAVGGELLSERQAGRLVWLQRLPAGLATPFWAKLVFHAAVSIAAGLLGLALAFPAAWLRGAAPQGLDGFVPAALCATALIALWTFAASSWTSRSVLSFSSAALVLAALVFPVWRVTHAGYRPTFTELDVFLGLLAGSALLGAWLGFVRGGLFGRGAGISALLGLAPATIVLGATCIWSTARLSELDVFDPSASDFQTFGLAVTGDGRVAFAVGHNEPRRWDTNQLPRYALRIDLQSGAVENLGRWVNQLHRYVEDEHGLRRTKELVVIVEGAEPFVFGMDDGQRHSWDPKVKDLGWWQGKGLGMLFEDAQSRRSMLRDPFRKRDFPAASLGDITYRGRLWVRPSRWLYAPSRARWFWLEPETMERTPVEWPEHSEPLVLFSDGRILIANATEGLQLVDPEHATAVTLDTHGVDVQYIYPNSNGMRVPFTNEAATEGSIVLQTNDRGWLVLDENATSVRRLPASEGVLVRMTGPNEAILQGWSDDGHLARISRIDLTTGALTPLWPPKASP